MARFMALYLKFHRYLEAVIVVREEITNQVKELTRFTQTFARPRTLFVTHHAGAREWVRRQGIVVDKMLDHLEPGMVRPDDLVIGSLPIQLVVEINRRGARYKHLSTDIPLEKRGMELCADDMEKYGARLEEFIVTSVSDEQTGKER